ncbi:MAG: DNA polymerase III subunit gamma/tau [Ignavibacteriae bacterium]|nr:DNA polymerase III subunit gamma/tau [Ignavibacteriota bacterium]
MSYQVTARKWRPMVFEDVVGQSHVTSTLANAIKTHRVAHAYVFSGQRGCGKTTTARILARALNCLSPNGINPDNTCEICLEITEGRSLDVIEIDGASNRGVEEIRNLRESVRYTPARGKYKIYIIDEVHMLTKEAFNALLKTLEEPPEHVVFIFATTEIHKVPATILSRCQRFDFRRIAIEEIISRLKFIAQEEKISIEDDALLVVAKKGDGSLRDAQSIFDQVRAFCGNEISAKDAQKVLNVVDLDVFFRVTDLMKAKDVRGGIDLVDDIIRNGYDIREFLVGLSEHLRNLLVVSTTQSTQLVETSDHHRKRYEAEASHFSENDLLRLIKLVLELEGSLRWSSQPRYKLEAGLLQMIKMHSAVRVDELLRQIDDLKKKLNGSSLSQQRPANVVPLPKEEVKVVGTVSAGMLNPASLVPPGMIPDAFKQPQVRLQSAFGASYAQPSMVRDRASQPSSYTAQRAPEPMQVISAEEAYASWQQWVSEVQRSRISVGSALEVSAILDVNNGALRIACPDDYHLTSLKRNEQLLTETFHKVTGRKVRIEPILHAAPPAASRSAATTHSATRSFASSLGSPATADSSPGSAPGLAEDHLVIKALRRELGAEPMEVH